MSSLSPHTDAVTFFGTSRPELLAKAFGTPLYVYNETILRQNCRDLMQLSSIPGFGVNYSVKANANPVLLRILREEKLVVDAMSPGELYMDFLAGFTPEEILYISNNNSEEEMANALAHGVIISVDSLSQLEMAGRLNPGGRVMIRTNPGIGAGHSDKVITGGKATKFGIVPEKMPEVLALLERYNLTLVGINQHIGSLFMQEDGYLDAVAILLSLFETLPESIRRQIGILDFGGGFGIPYHKHAGEARLDMKSLGKKLTDMLSAWRDKTRYSGRFLVEPGRYVMAEACVLIGRVTAVKDNGLKHFSGTDIGFNQLMRPVLYDSYHEIELFPCDDTPRPSLVQTVTGNICESGDILAKERELPSMREGDLIGVLDAGAYGFSMASTYNQRQRPAEILINQEGLPRLIRRRESLEDLCRTVAGLR
ncbi:MAG: diaminopimelate decarboxylase [Desulfovibrio sp.]|nr:diaminopimelate decarboxylase [Desulfovibrio sp.]